MPHCSVEYSANLENSLDIRNLCLYLQDVFMESGLFTPGHIKIRAKPYYNYNVEEKDGNIGFIHATASILKGRTKAQKKTLGQEILKKLKEKTNKVAHITVEVREIDPELYFKESLEDN